MYSKTYGNRFMFRKMFYKNKKRRKIGPQKTILECLLTGGYSSRIPKRANQKPTILLFSFTKVFLHDIVTLGKLDIKENLRAPKIRELTAYLKRGAPKKK